MENNVVMIHVSSCESICTILFQTNTSRNLFLNFFTERFPKARVFIDEQRLIFMSQFNHMLNMLEEVGNYFISFTRIIISDRYIYRIPPSN